MQNWLQCSSWEEPMERATDAGARRLYRMPWKRRIAALVLLLAACGFAVALWGGFLLQDRLDSGGAFGLPAVILFCGAILAAHLLLSAVILDERGIELRNLLGSRRLALAEIRGRRQYVSRG